MGVLVNMEKKLRYREAEKTREDALRVMEIRNDLEVLEASYHRTPKEMPKFYQEYLSYFLNTKLMPLFVLDDRDKKVMGFIRFNDYELGVPILELYAGVTTEISIMLASKHRNKGLGTQILKEVTAKALESVDNVVAEIKQANMRSVRAFENAGYKFHSKLCKIIDTGEKVPIFKYIARRNE